MRRLSDRARLEGMLALRKALDGVRRGSNATEPVDEETFRAAYSERRDDDQAAWLQRAELARDEKPMFHQPIAGDERVAAPISYRENDLDLAKALDRIADSIERIGAQLDSYHQERAEHLDAIEFLLREMVINSVPPTAPRSVVLGGVVDSEALEESDEGISILPDGYPLEVDVAVEVRSRFHDRWIAGFSIAEAVETAGRCRYRLTRRSDGIPLPILFEACDVRAVSAFDRKHAPSSRASVSEPR
jgi:hypothetical protein